MALLFYVTKTPWTLLPEGFILKTEETVYAYLISLHSDIHVGICQMNLAVICNNTVKHLKTST